MSNEINLEYAILRAVNQLHRAMPGAISGDVNTELRESMLIKCANNRGLDQPTHRCSQTRAFALRCMRSVFVSFIALRLW